MDSERGDNPIIIGALGGSGTRVFARIVRHAGVFIGQKLNVSEDSLPLASYFRTWIPIYLRYHDSLSEGESAAMQARLREAIAEHLSGYAGCGLWAAKNPRSIHLIQFLGESFPGLRFIHVVRSGLDSIYSGNRGQFNEYGDLVLSPEEREYPFRLQLMAYWSRMNLAAADYGEATLRDNYLRIRYEDLLTEPRQVVERIFAFLGATDAMGVARAVAEISSRSSVGRWRTHPVSEVADAMRVGRPALEKFGYWDPRVWDEIEGATRLSPWKQRLFQRTAMRRLPAGPPG
jgi:hypothetical protein